MSQVTLSPTAGNGELGYETSAGTTGWQDSHNAASSVQSATAQIWSVDNSLTGSSYIRRNFIPFDTSVLGSGAVITSAFVRVKGAGIATNDNDNDTICIVGTTQASSTALVAADYSRIGTTTFASMASTSFNSTNGANNDFNLNAAGLAAIVKNGVTYFGIRMESDRANAPPGDGKHSQVEHSGVANIQLIVTYTTGSLFTGQI